MNSHIGGRRIAFLGTRGVPAAYGGFETFVDQLGRRLVRAGAHVTVYCRTGNTPRDLRSYEGISLVVLPAPRHKYLETVVHGIFSAAHALGRRYDLVYVCNVANIPAVVLLVLFRQRVAVNVDGLEWRRQKWGTVGRTYYRACSWLAAKLPVELLSDARVIADFYQERYGRATTTIPYGTDLLRPPDDGTLTSLGLQAGGYVLYVSRFEPENNALTLIRAYRSVPGSAPLVLLGDAPYASDYIDAVRRAAAGDPRVQLLGAIYGSGYEILQSHALCYVQATEVGGTHPALVEAMGRGVAIIANDVPEHREVLGDAGTYYHGQEALGEELTELLANPERRAALGAAARRRAVDLYSWDAVARTYEAWITEVLTPDHPVPTYPRADLRNEKEDRI